MKTSLFLPTLAPAARWRLVALLAWSAGFFARCGWAAEASAIVAADGSGAFKSIQEAINAAPQLTSAADTWTIRIKPGTYRELVYVMREKRFVRLVGDDPATTIITHQLYAGMPGRDGQPIGTFRTPTVWVDADDFAIEGVTIANEAGAVGQALALRVDGDRVAFRRCRFLGWQDTILSNRGRHYFADCFITGAVDFIFGGGTAYFNRCEIVCTGEGYITAPSTLPDEEFGFVFVDCRIRGSGPEVRTYLGRPWRAFAAAAFINTDMTDVVRPEGWHNWDRVDRERSARFSEVGSRGAGARVAAAAAQRVTWTKPMSAAAAETLTPARVLGGRDGWSPAAPK